VGDPFSRERVQAAYDAAADDYAAAFGQDLDRLPLDRRMLDRAHEAAAAERILDLGCGTGSVGAYLMGRHARVVGVDLSLGMLMSGMRAHRMPCCQGDMRHLPFASGTFAAVVAYYSVQHVPRAGVGQVLAEAARVLRPGGALLVATHLGEGEVYMDEFLGRAVATTGGSLYGADELLDRVRTAGFTLTVVETRGPLEHEHQSQRIYVLARRPR
jgi:ubiquinone/menaquinone biosynthesis C-methylase UbiE